MDSYASLRIFIAFIIDYSEGENNSVISSSALSLKDPLSSPSLTNETLTGG